MRAPVFLGSSGSATRTAFSSKSKSAAAVDRRCAPASGIRCAASSRRSACHAEARSPHCEQGGLAERQNRRIISKPLARPPTAIASSGKSIAIQLGTNVARRAATERIACKQSQHVWRSLEQPCAEMLEPDVLLVASQRGEPHLPV